MVKVSYIVMDGINISFVLISIVHISWQPQTIGTSLISREIRFVRQEFKF